MGSVIKVESWFVINKSPKSELTFIQEMVCRIFKIIPDQKFIFTVRVFLKESVPHPGDLLMDSNGCRWIIKSRSTENTFEIENMFPAAAVCKAEKMTYMGAMFKE